MANLVFVIQTLSLSFPGAMKLKNDGNLAKTYFETTAKLVKDLNLDKVLTDAGYGADNDPNLTGPSKTLLSKLQVFGRILIKNVLIYEPSKITILLNFELMRIVFSPHSQDYYKKKPKIRCGVVDSQKAALEQIQFCYDMNLKMIDCEHPNLMCRPNIIVPSFKAAASLKFKH